LPVVLTKRDLDALFRDDLTALAVRERDRQEEGSLGRRWMAYLGTALVVRGK
jgi:hypothetical protein